MLHLSHIGVAQVKTEKWSVKRWTQWMYVQMLWKTKILWSSIIIDMEWNDDEGVIIYYPNVSQESIDPAWSTANQQI